MYESKNQLKLLRKHCCQYISFDMYVCMHATVAASIAIYKF